MPTAKPQPQILVIWRLALSLLAIVPALLASLLLRVGSAVWVLATCLWILLYLAMYLWYFPLRYKRLAYGISSETLVLVTGVFYNRVISVPLGAVQFTSVTQTILSRMFGLAALVVVAPGGRLVLPGLLLSDAKALAAALGEA